MSRIPYPSSAETPREAGGPQVLNIQKMLGHLPQSIQDGFGALGLALLWKGSLAPSLREIVIVRVGHLLNAKYELHHHVAFARAVGVSEAKLAALSKPEPGGALDATEAAAVALVDELVARARPSDAALVRVRALLDDSQLLELVVASGYYMMVCRILETSGVEIDSFELDPGKPEA